MNAKKTTKGLQASTELARADFRAAQRHESFRAFALSVPLLLFLVTTFVLPIGILLWRSIRSPEMDAVMPHLAESLRNWDGLGIPDENVFSALAGDIRSATQAGDLAQVGRRLNLYDAGFRSLLLKTSRRLAGEQSATWTKAITAIDPRWSDHETWRLMKRAAASLTPDYLLAAIDRQVGPDGHISVVASDQRLYLAALARTFWIGAIVTALCLLLGYPVAYLLATLPSRQSNQLMILVIVPFWTSLLVRTTAWYVLLQPNGIINGLIRTLKLMDAPLPLVFNRTGVLIGMTHVLLPFMILANYAVMRGISPLYQRAAVSLGAHPVVAFLRIYLPQTLPGIGAGAFLVFVLAIGYFITPALLGGSGDEMISQLISIQMERQLNWGLAGALSTYLVLFTLAFYFVFNRLVGVDRLRLG